MHNSIPNSQNIFGSGIGLVSDDFKIIWYNISLQQSHYSLDRILEKQAAKMNGRKSRNKKREKTFLHRTRTSSLQLLPSYLFLVSDWKKNPSAPPSCGHKNNRFLRLLLVAQLKLLRERERETRSTFPKLKMFYDFFFFFFWFFPHVFVSVFDYLMKHHNWL